jgi:flagellar hook-length control protein FliK
MINLSSLSALIRTLRHTSGVDAPASPVARVESVTPVAKDDAGAMTSTAVRPSPWARVQLTPLELAGDAATRQTDMRRDLPVHATGTSVMPSAQLSPAATAAATEETQSSALDFTAGARLLQAALRGTGLRTPTPPVISSPMPLVTSSRATPPELAQGLANAIAGSGLFYESHLARTLQRDYPVAALSREPQAAWPASAASDGFTASTSGAALPEAASTMLTKQLDVLDTRSLVWNGDVWPRQRATIAFEEERDAGDAANDAEDVRPPSSWRMRITLDLPSLGRVQATLAFRSDALDLALAATNEDTHARLTAARPELSNALEDAQLALGRFEVAVDPDA